MSCMKRVVLFIGISTLLFFNLTCLIKPKVYGSIESPDKQIRIDFAQVDPGAIGSSTTHLYLIDNNKKTKKELMYINGSYGVKGCFQSDTIFIYTFCDSANYTLYFSSYLKLLIKVKTLDYYSDFFKTLGPKLPDEE
jgi:hypothetical protein